MRLAYSLAGFALVILCRLGHGGYGSRTLAML